MDYLGKPPRHKPSGITGGLPLLLLVCLVVFIDSVGYGVVVPVLPLYAKTLRVSDFQIGFLFATYAIALLVGAIPVGILSDRMGRKPFVLFGMFAMSGAFVFYALANSYATLVIARVLDGLTAAATWSAGLALLGDRFEASEMGEKMGYAIAAMAVGGVAGPLLGGVLSDAVGYRAPFYAIAGACFAGGAAAVYLREDKSTRHSTASAWGMLKTVLAKRPILLALLITLVTTTGLGLLEPTLPIYLSDKLGMSRTEIGIVFGLTMLFYAAASPTAGKISDSLGRKKPILAGLVATAVITPLLVASKNVVLIYALMALLGLTITAFETPSVPLVTDAMPRGADEADIHYGTAFGLLNLFWSLGYVVGPLLGGAITGWVGLFAALLVYSVILVGLAAVVLVFLKD